MIKLLGPELGKMAQNTIRLLESLADSELEDAIKRLNLEPEFLGNMEEITDKIFDSIHHAFSRRPTDARGLAKLFIASNFIIYPGSKKILRLSYENLAYFALDTQIRKTPAAQLAWDLRIKHHI